LFPGRTIFFQQIQAAQFTQKPILSFEPLHSLLAQAQGSIKLFKKWFRHARFELLNQRWI
jgi:hypothetical protein